TDEKQFIASLRMTIKGLSHRWLFWSFFNRLARNLASGGRLVRVEVSRKICSEPFITSEPGRG
ncbi:MAG TPA: hypothetical protein VMO76_00765, partial [Candidatus Udaeobacter sp.]|nr:hypothetical protein [Candidatus Udaeobacter sp.]